MKKFLKTLLAGAVALAMTACSADKADYDVDICVYGGTSAGVIAAYTAAKSGKTVLLVEPGRHLGGMTSGGLGYTDIGNKFVVTGLARDFYRRVGAYYGKLEQWVFEPSVAEAIFNGYIERGDVDVLYSRRITAADVSDRRIRTITLESSDNPESEPTVKVRAREFIDCSYEGDLMAHAGATYTVGREGNDLYGEHYNGVQVMRGHQFWDPIDPYVIPGDSTSGLIWGVNPGPVAPAGTGDGKVQAYNYRVCLTDNPENMVEITEPDNYDPARYELALRLHEVSPRKSVYDYFIWSRMPNGKTDINNGGGISTDMIGMNWEYPEANYARRAEIVKAHEDYTKGFFYFLGHDERVPEFMRKEMLKWGYPKDEYTDNGHWSYQLYVREARRLVGEEVMTEAHCVGEKVAPDPVGWAAYTMDSHNCDRQVIDGVVKNEGNVEIGGFPPFPISYRALVPKRDELTNLLVPVCLSASHIAYGSIRMEPVFMVLAQASAVAAVLAIDGNCPVQDVEAAAIADVIAANPLMDGSVPEVIVDDSDSTAVVFTGEWSEVSDPKRAYGPGYRVSGPGESEARFTPTLSSAGTYDVYVYIPRIENPADSFSIEIFDGKETLSVGMRPSTDEVIGQTFGEWQKAGRFNLAPGAFATLRTAAPSTVADALLFRPI